jgi:hypothetical protein
MRPMSVMGSSAPSRELMSRLPAALARAFTRDGQKITKKLGPRSERKADHTGKPLAS